MMRGLQNLLDAPLRTTWIKIRYGVFNAFNCVSAIGSIENTIPDFPQELPPNNHFAYSATPYIY